MRRDRLRRAHGGRCTGRWSTTTASAGHDDARRRGRATRRHSSNIARSRSSDVGEPARRFVRARGRRARHAAVAPATGRSSRLGHATAVPAPIGPQDRRVVGDRDATRRGRARDRRTGVAPSACAAPGARRAARRRRLVVPSTTAARRASQPGSSAVLDASRKQTSSPCVWAAACRGGRRALAGLRPRDDHVDVGRARARLEVDDRARRRSTPRRPRSARSTPTGAAVQAVRARPRPSRAGPSRRRARATPAGLRRERDPFVRVVAARDRGRRSTRCARAAAQPTCAAAGRRAAGPTSRSPARARVRSQELHVAEREVEIARARAAATGRPAAAT